MRELQYNVSLSEYCTYTIGGPAKELILVETREELAYAFSLGKRYIIIGKGSNALFDDRGFNGLVIVNRIQGIEWKEESVTVGSGYSFALLGTQASRKGFAGLEFASGIPGSVGGAIAMNAGAGKAEVKDVCESVEFMHETGEIETFRDIEFSYRHSPFQGMKGGVVSATFRLTPSAAAKQFQENLLAYRMCTQPYKSRSCGCVFRNPTGDSAGRLIDSLGLKGFMKGGAKISEKHGNFIVNESGAKAADILALIEEIQKKVHDQTGIHLEPEVKYIPYDEKI